jgi:hypothetical protein
MGGGALARMWEGVTGYWSSISRKQQAVKIGEKPIFLDNGESCVIFEDAT